MQTEQALLNAAQQWRATFDAIHDAVSLVDLEEKTLRCNLSLTRLLGKPFNEIIGHTCYELVHGTTEPVQGCPHVRMKETRRRESLVLPMGNRWFNIVADPIMDEGGNLIGSVHIISDITERKQAEDALEESKKKFQELFDEAPVGYHEFDSRGRITKVNRTELEMLGYRIDEMLGQPVWKFIGEEELSRQATLNKLAGLHPPNRGLDRTYRRKDGSTFPALIEDRLIRSLEGEIIGVRSTIQDITERKRVEQETASLQNQLRQSQKVEAIGQLAGGIAHDFNNLLTIIQGNSQLSLMDLREGDPLRANIEEIQEAAKRAADLTRQLLAFSRKQILEMKVLRFEPGVAATR